MRLEWTNLARTELQELRRYSVDRWGPVLARQYISDIRDVAKHLARNPESARSLDRSLRIARVRSHYLIVEVDVESDRLVVARVLHTAMDIERHLPEK